MSVLVGAQRFCHCQWLRADRVLHALLGLERFPSDDTIRNFFLRFSQGQIEPSGGPSWRWLLRLLQCPPALRAGLGLDGVWPRGPTGRRAQRVQSRRKGRNSHHPLLAVWPKHRSSCTLVAQWEHGAARGVVPFLQEALALLPEGMWVRTLRADSGFFDGNFLDFLEERGLPYGCGAPDPDAQTQCPGSRSGHPSMTITRPGSSR